MITINSNDTQLVSPDDAETGETTYTSFFPWFYNTFCKNISEDLRLGSLMYAILLIIFYWAICYVLDKRKIYIKV